MEQRVLLPDSIVMSPCPFPACAGVLASCSCCTSGLSHPLRGSGVSTPPWSVSPQPSLCVLRARAWHPVLESSTLLLELVASSCR